MIYAVLLDIDGVINHAERFSSRYSKEFGISPAVMAPFFNNAFNLCTLGKADLKTELQYVLSDWQWKKSVDELLVYWFGGEIHLDEQILILVERLRAQGIQVFAATDQEKYRSAYMLETIGLRKYFDKVFVSCNLGMRKNNPEFFIKVLEDIQKRPSEVIFWDDDPLNIEVAEKVGLHAYLYTSYDVFVRTLSHHMPGITI